MNYHPSTIHLNHKSYLIHFFFRVSTLPVTFNPGYFHMYFQKFAHRMEDVRRAKAGWSPVQTGGPYYVPRLIGHMTLFLLISLRKRYFRCPRWLYTSLKKPLQKCEKCSATPGFSRDDGRDRRKGYA